MDRFSRILSHSKGSKISKTTRVPLPSEGSDGDMKINNGALYVKDGNIWYEYAPVSPIVTTPVTFGVLVATSGNVASGSTYNSGAMLVPANSVITDLGCVVKTACAAASGTWGVSFGTTANATDIATLAADGLETTATAVAVGIGTAMDPVLQTALGGTAVVVMDPGDAYSAARKNVHGSVVSSGGSITAGNIMFWVKYLTIDMSSQRI